MHPINFNQKYYCSTDTIMVSQVLILYLIWQTLILSINHPSKVISTILSSQRSWIKCKLCSQSLSNFNQILTAQNLLMYQYHGIQLQVKCTSDGLQHLSNGKNLFQQYIKLAFQTTISYHIDLITSKIKINYSYFRNKTFDKNQYSSYRLRQKIKLSSYLRETIKQNQTRSGIFAISLNFTVINTLALRTPRKSNLKLKYQIEMQLFATINIVIQEMLVLFAIQQSQSLSQSLIQLSIICITSIKLIQMLGHNPTTLDSYNKGNKGNQGTLIANWFEERVHRDFKGQGRAMTRTHLPKSHNALYDSNGFGVQRTEDDTKYRILGDVHQKIGSTQNYHYGKGKNKAESFAKTGRKQQLIQEMYLKSVTESIKEQQRRQSEQARRGHFQTTSKATFVPKPLNQNVIGKLVMRDQDGRMVELNSVDEDLRQSNGFKQRGQITPDEELKKTN